MPLLERINVKKSWSFNEPVCSFVGQNEQDLTAKVFSNNNEAWISNGPSLCAVQIPSGHSRPIWDFGKTLKDTMDVTCVEEVSLDYDGRSSFLLVGTSSERRSQLCFMNLNTNLLFRAVNLPFQVRCISVIDNGLGSVNPLPDILSKMQGIVALGGADGSVILMDINRSHVIHGAKWKAIGSEYSSDESKPCRSKVLSLPCDDLDSYFNELKEFQRNGDSLAISLLVGHGSDGVTSLQYSKLTSSLYVGYSSGIWQIWNISTFELLYENVDVDLPVFSFCEMEPCDDPDATIYIWVSYQSASNAHPSMAFYSTVYNSKYHVQDYGDFYKDFSNCVHNFTINIQDEINNCVGSKLISCETFAKSIPRNTLFNIGLPPAENGQCRLFVAAFNAYGGRKSSSTWLCVFDLEQWYRELLPKDIRHNNYFLEWIEIYPEALLTVKVAPDSIRLPSFEEPREIHLIPEALNFDIVAMSRDGIISIEKIGRQTRWLRNVSYLGARCLLHPEKLYQSCVAAGFVPQYASIVEHSNRHAITEEQKRNYLLSVCLEHGLKSIILEAAELWSDGHFTVKNCTLRFLLDWLWSSLQCCYKQFNKKCETLFSAPGFEIDDRMKRNLYRAEIVLCLIESLYVEIVKKHGLKIWADCSEQRLTAMSLIRLVVSQITWFLGCSLLPEANSDGLPRSSPVYDYETIARYSKKRRDYLRNLLANKRLLGDGPVVPPPCGLYLADSLLTSNQVLAYSQWEIDGGLDCYPPPSLQSLLRMCTIVDIPFDDKLSVIYYSALDYVHNLEKKKFSSIIRKVMSFDYLPGITIRKAKVVKGLWLIDHADYQEGVKLLLDKSILNSDLTDDQHRSVVRVLLLEGESRLALHYLKIRQPQKFQPDDLKYELSLLLTNKHLVHHAFQFTRQHTQFRRQLLVQFFAGCVETKEISQVFNFHLDACEMEIFEKYLASKKGQLYEDLHVLLLLTRSKYTDAVKLHLRYAQNGNPKDPLKFDTRDTIIKGILSSLCDVTKREAGLMNYPNLTSLPEIRGLKANKPLSVYLKCTRENGLPNFRYDCDRVMALCLASSELVNSKRQDQIPDKKEAANVGMPLTGALIEAQIAPTRKRVGETFEPKRVKRARFDGTSSTYVVHHDPPVVGQMNGDVKPKSNATVSDEITALLDIPLVRRRSKEMYSTPGRSEGPPSSILKSGKTPQTPGPGTTVQLMDNDTPRKTLRWNIPTDSSRENIIDSVKKSLVPVDIKRPSATDTSEAEGEGTLSPDSIKDRLRPRKSKESPVQDRKVIPDDDWKAVENDTVEKPLFAVTLPTKKKIIPAAVEANEPNFIERLKKLTEAHHQPEPTKELEPVEEMDVDSDENIIPPSSDFSITIDSAEMSIFCKEGKPRGTTEMGRTMLVDIHDKNEELEEAEICERTTFVDDTQKELIVEKEPPETEASEVFCTQQDDFSAESELASGETPVPEECHVQKEIPVSEVEETVEPAAVELDDDTPNTGGKKSRDSSVDRIQIRHAVSLSQVQHLEEDDDEGSEDPEEAEIPPVIEFFPPEEGLVVNPMYHENVEDEEVEEERQGEEEEEDSQGEEEEEDRQDEEIEEERQDEEVEEERQDEEEEDFAEEDDVEYESQQVEVESEQEESNDKADSDDSSVIICLSDSDKSGKEEENDSDESADDDLSPVYDTDSSSIDLGRGNRSFFHDKFNTAQALSECEQEERFQLKVDEGEEQDDDDDEEEDDEVEQEDTGDSRINLKVVEELAEGGDEELSEARVTKTAELVGRTELEIIPEEDEEALQTLEKDPLTVERDVEESIEKRQSAKAELENEEVVAQVSDSKSEQEPSPPCEQPETEVAPTITEKPETLDLINLNKGQMFFGSPDSLKSTANCELATFQIAPGSNVPPPSPEPSKEIESIEIGSPVKSEDSIITEDPHSSLSQVNIGFVADEIPVTPKVSMGTPLRKSLRLLQRQTPGRQIVPDNEVVESDGSLDVALLGDTESGDASSPWMVDKSVLTVKRTLNKSFDEMASNRKKSQRRQSSEPPELLSQRSSVPESKRLRRASSIDPQESHQRSLSPKEKKIRGRRSSSKEPVAITKEKRTRRTSESQSSVDSRKSRSSSVEPEKSKDTRRSSKQSEHRSKSRSHESPATDTESKNSSQERKTYTKKKPRHSITEPLETKKNKRQVEGSREDNEPRVSSHRKRAMSLNEYPVSTRTRNPTALESIQEVPEEQGNPPAPKRRVTRSVADGDVCGGRSTNRSSAPRLPPSRLDINKWLQFQKTQESRRSRRTTGGESSSVSQQSSPRRSSMRISSHKIKLQHLYSQLAEHSDNDELDTTRSPAKSSITSVASSRVSARRRPSSRNSLIADEAASPIATPVTSMTQEEKEQIFEEHSQQRIMTRKQTTFLQRCLGLESNPATPSNPTGSSSPSRRPKEDEDTPKTSRKKQS